MCVGVHSSNGSHIFTRYPNVTSNRLLHHPTRRSPRFKEPVVRRPAPRRRRLRLRVILQGNRDRRHKVGNVKQVAPQQTQDTKGRRQSLVQPERGHAPHAAAKVGATPALAVVPHERRQHVGANRQAQPGVNVRTRDPRMYDRKKVGAGLGTLHCTQQLLNVLRRCLRGHRSTQPLVPLFPRVGNRIVL